MRRVSYAGGSFVTSDQVAAVVLAFAEELANHERAASIAIPAMDLAGDASTIDVLVGPSSQLLSEPVDDDRVLDGGDFVAEMESRIHDLRSPTTDWDGGFDWETGR